MNWSRRVATACCGLVLAAISAGAFAQNYPSRPLRLIVGFPPGGGADFAARITAQILSDGFAQQVIVDNRPGANAIIGTDLAAKATPDGYTLLLGVASSHAINPNVYAKLPYDAIRDFAPVTELGYTPLIVVVNPSLPATSIKELIALAKAKPGQLNFASAGNGNITHLAVELFKHMTGVSMVHVPYKGSAPAITDLIAGQISLYFDTMPSSLPYVRSNRLRALAVTSAKRSRGAPGIPTVAEAGVPGFETTNWFGVFGPAGTPKAIANRLNTVLVNALNQPDVQERLANQGLEPVGDTPEHFAATLKAEIEKWKKVTTEANIRID